MSVLFDLYVLGSWPYPILFSISIAGAASPIQASLSAILSGKIVHAVLISMVPVNAPLSVMLFPNL